MKNRSILVLATLVAFVAAPAFLSSQALAIGQKSVSNEAEFVKFDQAANKITIKITKRGKGNKKLMHQFRNVRPGKEVTMNVIPTGSVLTRTSVAVNGVKGDLKDIHPGKTILVYWVEDVKHKGELFARKIDVVLSEQELDKRYETVK